MVEFFQNINFPLQKLPVMLLAQFLVFYDLYRSDGVGEFVLALENIAKCSLSHLLQDFVLITDIRAVVGYEGVSFDFGWRLPGV